MFVQILTEGRDDPNKPTEADAHYWAYELDFDGTGDYDPSRPGGIGITVIADTDRTLWAAYNECGYTPQMFIIDQGGVLVDDNCTGDAVACFLNCGAQSDRARDVLDAILPPKWCGTAQP